MSRNEDDVPLTFIFVAVMPVDEITAAITGCTDPEGAERTLAANGYTEIKLNGSDYAACGNDWYSTRFEARSPSGTHLTGVVCKGFWQKATTIRFE